MRRVVSCPRVFLVLWPAFRSSAPRTSRRRALQRTFPGSPEGPCTSPSFPPQSTRLRYAPPAPRPPLEEPRQRKAVQRQEVCCELPAGPGPGAARRAREAKRSVQRCGRNAPSPRALRPRRAAREEWSASYLPCLRVGRRATADSAIPTRPTPCPRVSAVGARCGSASLGGGCARGAPGRQLAPAERARGRFLTSCLGAGERPLPRATRPLDAVGPLPQDERGRSERGARRRAKGRERSDTTRHERSDTTRHEFFSFLFFRKVPQAAM